MLVPALLPRVRVLAPLPRLRRLRGVLDGAPHERRQLARRRARGPGHEEGVGERVRGGAASRRLEHEQPTEEAERERRRVRRDGAERHGRHVGELDLAKVREFVGRGPPLLRRRPHLLEDGDELLDIRVCRERLRVFEHLAEDAARGPGVDALRVFPRTEQDLRRPVRPRGHLVRIFCLLRVQVEGPRLAKVADLQRSVGLDE
mmetsp:Transcript_5948/g.21191  ORF Transcript_5948/g.21191 Transcript_5948/m.21191 type:complete len:203 (-) Transcript_5948:587-1195(-)